MEDGAKGLHDALREVGKGLAWMKPVKTRWTIETSTTFPDTSTARRPRRKSDEVRQERERKERERQAKHKEREERELKKRKRNEQQLDDELRIEENEIELVETPAVWSQATHLMVAERVRNFLDVFAATSFIKIHPAVLDEDTRSWFFSSDESLRISSPLAFNVTVAICVGAAALGDKAVEEEYWQRAREQAGQLFDCTDFYVAFGLLKMCEYCTFNARPPAQGHLYASVALAMCENLGCYNTTQYMWLISQMYLTPTNFDIQTFLQKVKRAKEKPQLVEAKSISRTPGGDEDPTASLVFELSQPHPTQCIQQQQQQQQPQQYQHQQQRTRQQREVPDFDLDFVFQDMVAKISLLFSQIASSMNDPQQLMEVEGELVPMSKVWGQVRHVFRPFQRLLMDLSFVQTIAMVSMGLGKTAKAQHAAMSLLEIAQTEPLFVYMPLYEAALYPTLLPLLDTPEGLRCLSRLLPFLEPCNKGTLLNGTMKIFKDRIQEMGL